MAGIVRVHGPAIYLPLFSYCGHPNIPLLPSVNSRTTFKIAATDSRTAIFENTKMSLSMEEVRDITAHRSPRGRLQENKDLCCLYASGKRSEVVDTANLHGGRVV